MSASTPYRRGLGQAHRRRIPIAERPIGQRRASDEGAWFPPTIVMALQSGFTGFPGTHTHDFLEPRHKNLSVADLAGAGGARDRLDHLIHLAGLDSNLYLHLGQEIDDVLGAAIKLGMAFLPAKAFYFRHGHPLHADLGERRADVVELVRLDYGGNESHRGPPFRVVNDPACMARASSLYLGAILKCAGCVRAYD